MECIGENKILQDLKKNSGCCVYKSTTLYFKGYILKFNKNLNLTLLGRACLRLKCFPGIILFVLV